MRAHLTMEKRRLNLSQMMKMKTRSSIGVKGGMKDLIWIRLTLVPIQRSSKESDASIEGIWQIITVSLSLFSEEDCLAHHEYCDLLESIKLQLYF